MISFREVKLTVARWVLSGIPTPGYCPAPIEQQFNDNLFRSMGGSDPIVIVNYSALARRIGCSRHMVRRVITGERKSRRVQAAIKSLLKIESLHSIKTESL
jgi:hypothetical protein